MKLRIRSSLLGNARFGLVVGLALASGVGCSDDDSVPDFPAPDGGGTESTATMDESSTGGGGNNTDETAATSDTSSADTLTVNPDTSTGSTTGGETSVPTDSSEPGTDTTDVMTTAPTSDIVDSHTTDLTLPTSEPMSSAASSSGDSSGEPLPNLVANGDFEAGIDGWTTWNNTTLTASTAKARSGTTSLLASGGDATGPANVTVTPIVPGATYQATFWVSVGTGSAEVNLTRRLDCGEEAYEWITSAVVVSSSGWTELVGEIDVPVDCDSTFFAVFAEGPGVGVDLYIDDVSVVLLSGPDTGSTDTTSDTGATSADVDSGVVDTTTPPDETTEMMPDGGVDASSTEPVDTTDEMTDPDASVTTDVVTPDAMTTEEPEPYGADLVSNGTFESGESWWWYNTGDATIAVSSAQAHSGTYSLLTTGRTANWHAPATNLLDAGITTALVPGSTYFAQVYARLNGTASETVKLTIATNCDDTPSYPDVDVATATDTGWTLLEGTFTVPECVSLSQYQLYVQSDNVTLSYYVDDLTIREVLIP